MKTPNKNTVHLCTLVSALALASLVQAQNLSTFVYNLNDVENTPNNSNFGATLQFESGDFDGEADALDQRAYNPIDSTAITREGIKFKAGFQSTYFDYTASNPNRGICRWHGGATPDAFQVGNVATTATTGPAHWVFSPNVVKADFLNGQNEPGFNLKFSDEAASVQIKVQSNVNLTSSLRALVRNGTQWYVSNSAVTGVNTLSINGHTETWTPYDPTVNQLLPTPFVAGSVAGSALTDIQAFGAHVQVNNATLPNSQVRLSTIAAKMDQVAPSFPPTTPVVVANTDSKYENDTSDNLHTMPFRVISGVDTKLVVAVGGEGTGGPTSVTYGGVALTGPVVSVQNQDVSFWYLDDPTPGDANIVATLVNNKDSRIVALSLINAADGIGSSTSLRSDSTEQLDLTLAAATPNTLFVGAYVNNDVTITSTPFGLGTNVVNNVGSGSSRMSLGYITAETISNPPATFSWTNSASNRSSAALIGISPAGEIEEVLPANLYEFNMPLTGVSPTVDGIKSVGEWGDTFQIPMIWPELGVLPNVGGVSIAPADAQDLSGVFSLKWDATYLYILAEIADEVLIKPSTTGAGFPNDHILLAIDPDVTDGDASSNVFMAEFFIDSSNTTRAFYRTDLAVVNQALNVFTNHSFVANEVPGGYVMEIRLKWSDLGVAAPTNGTKIGLAMLLGDNDVDDNARDTLMRSAGGTNNATMVTPSLYHEATLRDPINTFANFMSRFDVGIFDQLNDDPDSDGRTNNYEWRFGGNPAVNDQDVFVPTVTSENGVLTFKYNRRLGAAALGISYLVQTDTTLVAPTWDRGGITEIGAAPADEEFEQVTVTTPLDSERIFIRVKSE
jgi:hypothetical protein